MGRKVSGGTLKEDSPYKKLMLIWILFHARAKTPVLIHENVMSFNTDYLVKRLAGVGYLHAGTIKTAPAHCGISVNSRNRVHLA